MNTFQKPLAIAAVFVAGALCATIASATPFIVTLLQQGSNVVATGSGAIDLTNLTLKVAIPSYPPNLGPNGGELVIGDGNNGFDAFGGTIMGPSNFGIGNQTTASSESGDSVGYDGVGYIGVPSAYVSDTALSSTATWANQTFASLGVTPGTYMWTWGAGADQSFTLQIGPAAINTPEPSALAMFGGGLLLLGAFVGLRRRLAA